MTLLEKSHDEALHDTEPAVTETPAGRETSAAPRGFRIGLPEVMAMLRLSLGWVFLWAFLDKTFGLGVATESSNAWIDGGSPTDGFLSFGTKGPLADFYQSFAGEAWADWLFMLGLLGIGAALMLGIGMRIAAATGALLLVMMWSAALWPENNPFVDDHLVYAIALVALAMYHAGDTWGFGKAWKKIPFVKDHSILY